MSKKHFAYQINDFKLKPKIQEHLIDLIKEQKPNWRYDDTRTYKNVKKELVFGDSPILNLIEGNYVQVVGCAAKPTEFGWHTDYDSKWGAILPLFQLHQCYLQFKSRPNEDENEPIDLSIARRVGQLYVGDLSQMHRIYNPKILNRMTLVTALFDFKASWKTIAKKKGIDFSLITK